MAHAGRAGPSGLSPVRRQVAGGGRRRGAASAGDGALRRQLTQFLVPADTAGITIEPLEGLDLVRRFARVRFDGVELEEASVVGTPGGAADDVERQLQIGLAVTCAESAGAVARVFEFTLELGLRTLLLRTAAASYQAEAPLRGHENLSGGVPRDGFRGPARHRCRCRGQRPPRPRGESLHPATSRRKSCRSACRCMAALA